MKLPWGAYAPHSKTKLQLLACLVFDLNLISTNNVNGPHDVGDMHVTIARSKRTHVTSNLFLPVMLIGLVMNIDIIDADIVITCSTKADIGPSCESDDESPVKYWLAPAAHVMKIQ